MNTPIKQTDRYFDIFRCLKKGGLSLWLNRRSLLPMTILPTIATFIVLTVVRSNVIEDPSVFTLALMQVPADFITGLFCALIIVIITNAPKKKDKDAPIVFALNIMDKKKVMFVGAVAHVVFSYLSAGLYGAMDLLSAPTKQAMKAVENAKPEDIEELSKQATELQESVASGMSSMLVLIPLMLIGLYSVRFMLLPVLLISGLDVKSFYKNNMAFGLSVPVFFVKAATTFVIGTTVYIMFGSVMSGDEEIPLLVLGLLDFITAFGSVMAFAWAYASLSVGIRQMIDRE